MRIMIESTDQLTTIDGVPVRLWEGITEEGTPCAVMVHRIVVRDGEEAVFVAELQEIPAPSSPLTEADLGNIARLGPVYGGPGPCATS